MGLVNKADGVRFHTVFLYGFLCSESKVLAKSRAQRGWMCPLFFTVTSTPHGSVYRPSELNTLPRCQLYARCARDHEATHVRFAHGTGSVLKVGREGTHGCGDVGITHVPVPRSDHRRCCGSCPGGSCSGSSSLAISRTSRSGTLCLIGSAVLCALTVSVGRLVKRAHVDPGPHSVPRRHPHLEPTRSYVILGVTGVQTLSGRSSFVGRKFLSGTFTRLIRCCQSAPCLQHGRSACATRLLVMRTRPGICSTT